MVAGRIYYAFPLESQVIQTLILTETTTTSSLLPCQWRRIIGSSFPLTSTKYKNKFNRSIFTHQFTKVIVFPTSESHNDVALAIKQPLWE
ncbi:hypothetical protein CWC46_03640 [Prodigiosinella confusarubida]|uniref:Uncharacterized protein n=1 Tax=Serratia sp. (strain ATCC 39006) TaxID=104623 RepID=A0A2I5T356_SERS3|nr:hypothetical protein CWC46_03640 [Serratia sp. ATCC 39006]AUH03309.1 hypothetical protein Ser39006_003640 [Serratia sp. ATCC 39006]